MAKIENIDGLPLRFNDGSLVHAVQGSVVQGDILLLWTLCLHDVPADAAVTGDLQVTCVNCLEEMDRA